MSRTQTPFHRISLEKMQRSCGDVCALLRALSHPQRLMILGHLLGGEKTVSELQALCGVSQSQLSQFLARMRAERLVRCRREGRYLYYAPSDPRVPRLISAIQSIYCR